MDEVYKQIVNIAKKYNTKKVVLFGSRARGTNHPKSCLLYTSPSPRDRG